MNLKNSFEELLSGFGLNQKQINIEWNFLLDSYIVNRTYHNINHIIKMLELFEPHTDKVENPSIFKLGILYHDIVYLPGDKRNERESAIVFNNRFESYLNTFERYEVLDLIQSTESGSVLDTYEKKLINDIDYVSGLSGDYEEFELNNNKIIREFELIYPKDLVLKGRENFLKNLIEINFINTLEFLPFKETIIHNINTYLTQEVNEYNN